MMQMVENIAYTNGEDVWIVDEFDERVHMLTPEIRQPFKDSFFEAHSISRDQFHEMFEESGEYIEKALYELSAPVRHLLVLFMWGDIEY